MQIAKRSLGVFALISLLIGFIVPAAVAQDEMAKITCDSTLVTLLLVAEHDYDYLSAKMMDEEMMDHPALRIDKGALTPLVEEIMAMMIAMMEEDPNMGMTPEQMAAHDAMLAEMMMKTPAEMVASYMMSMNMEMAEEMTELQPGNVAGEDPVCTEVRADVEKFIIAHLVTEMALKGMEDQ